LSLSLFGSNITKEVGALAAFRGFFNLSQADLTILTGVARATMSRLENKNERAVRADTLVTLLDTFELLGATIRSDAAGELTICITPEGISLGEDMRSLKGDAKLAYLADYLDYKLESLSTILGKSERDDELTAACLTSRKRLRSYVGK